MLYRVGFVGLCVSCGFGMEGRDFCGGLDLDLNLCCFSRQIGFKQIIINFFLTFFWKFLGFFGGRNEFRMKYVLYCVSLVLLLPKTFESIMSIKISFASPGFDA